MICYPDSVQRIRTTTGQVRRRVRVPSPATDSGASSTKRAVAEQVDRRDALRQAALDLHRGDKKATKTAVNANPVDASSAGLRSTMPLVAQQLFDALGRHAHGGALLALERAGIGPPTVDRSTPDAGK